MRFLIQHSRWTLEFFTSTQQQPVGCSAEQSNSTLASRDHILKSVATSPGHSPIIPSAIPKSSAKVEDISIESELAPTRNRNIRKRLGRFFLHFAQTNSHSKDETHAYQYNGNASELPAGDIPIEGSTTVEEMPTSFDDCTAFELQSQPYSSSGHFYSMNSSQDEIPYSSQQDFCKPTYTREISIARGSSHAAIPQRLPRLAVPGSLHDLPAMTTEQSPHSASTISPNTPVNPFHNSAQPYWLSQSPHTVSPCDAPTSQWYDRPSFQAQHMQHMRRSFGSPMTISPAGSSNSTTPMSAHSTSVHTSFGHWPQPGPEYLQAAFPQRYQPLGYESCTQPVSHQPIAWTTDVNIQPHQYHNSASRVQEQMTASEQCQDLSQFRNQPKPTAYDMSEKSLYAEAQLLPAIQIDDTTTYDCEAIEPPPAYSPVSTSKTKYPAAICYYCSKSFTGKYGKGNCKRHVQQVHETVLDKLMHMCKVCFKTYNRADALRKHQWKKHRDADARPNKRRRS